MTCAQLLALVAVLVGADGVAVIPRAVVAQLTAEQYQDARQCLVKNRVRYRIPGDAKKRPRR